MKISDLMAWTILAHEHPEQLVLSKCTVEGGSFFVLLLVRDFLRCIELELRALLTLSIEPFGTRLTRPLGTKAH